MARHWLGALAGLALLGALVLALIVGTGWAPGSGSHAAHSYPAVLPTPAPTVFVPISADQDDASGGVVIAYQNHPSFQFQVDGATLSGAVRDAATGRPIARARVWLTLAPAAFTPAAVLITTTTDLSGRYRILHLAPGTYALAAARPLGRGAPYALASCGFTLGAQTALTENLTLRRLATGERRLRRGVARNAIVVELNGVYAETWQGVGVLAAPHISRLAANGFTARNAWADYGWPLADDNVLATGDYPSWRLFDPWPRLVPWGTPDGIDQETWYDAMDPAASAGDFWGQDSVFDVARRFGLATGWLGAAERRPQHLNPTALSLSATLGPPTRWAGALDAALSRLARAPGGFLLYLDLAPPPAPQGEQESSPAAAGGRYQQTVALYDAVVGALLHALSARHLRATTSLVLIAGEAEAGHDAMANYYGWGATGRGTSLHIPLILNGPGVVAGRHWNGPVSADAIAPTVTALLGLPPPAGARVPALRAALIGPAAL